MCTVTEKLSLLHRICIYRKFSTRIHRVIILSFGLAFNGFFLHQVLCIFATNSLANSWQRKLEVTFRFRDDRCEPMSRLACTKKTLTSGCSPVTPVSLAGYHRTGRFSLAVSELVFLKNSHQLARLCQRKLKPIMIGSNIFPRLASASFVWSFQWSNVFFFFFHCHAIKN